MRFFYLILLPSLVYSCRSDKAKKTLKYEKDNSAVETKIMVLTDTLFMDFFEEFMWDKDFQKSRIVFPYKQDSKNILTFGNWKHLSFYSESEYIPILNSDTISLYDQDVKTKTIGLSIVNFKNNGITKYNFKKIESNWYLLSSEHLAIENVPDFEFIHFLETFSNESVFQISHTVFPLLESYADPYKDYETVKRTILLKNWKHLNLIDFTDRLIVLSNIDEENKYRNIFYQGVENGIWVKYTFEKINGNWKLIKLEDHST